MKTFDRYVLVAFARNYLLTLGVLLGLYVVLDMVLNFDEFAVDDVAGRARSSWSVVAAIADFYGAQSVLIFTQLAGVIPVVAAAFTLMRLSRFNEMTALLAAGVPLLRVAAPIGVAAVALTLVTLVGHELIVPQLAQKLVRERDQAGRDASLLAFPVEALPVRRADGSGALVYAGRYEPGEPGEAGRLPRLRAVTVVEVDSDFDPTAVVTAEEATWQPGGFWRLEGGRRDAVAAAGEQPAPPVPVSVLEIDLDPAAISLLHRKDYAELLPLTQINRLLERPDQVRAAAMLQVKHGRLAALVVNVVLVLLAIPAVLTREPGQLKQSAAKCLALVGGCMASIFVCQTLAGQVPPDPAWAARWPAVMSWVPVFVFGPLAVALLERVKT